LDFGQLRARHTVHALLQEVTGRSRLLIHTMVSVDYNVQCISLVDSRSLAVLTFFFTNDVTLLCPLWQGVKHIRMNDTTKYYATGDSPGRNS
jgi:hypothetical protein